MIADLFGTLLQELGTHLDIPDLHPDRNNSCLVKLVSGLEVQLELNSRADALIVGADLGQVHPGRYREDIFREALKTNGLEPPHHGIFAYSKQTDHFILHESLDTRELTGEKIFDFLQLFEEKALKWGQAIAQNEVPVVSSMKTSMGLGMFGLKP